MASVKHIYSLLQLSPTKAVHGHDTLCVGANEPNCHHHSLSHHLIAFSPSISKLGPPLLLMPFYPYTSLGRRICHITDRICMYMCEYNSVKYGLSRLTPDVAFALKFILTLKPIPYQLTMACTRLHTHSCCIARATLLWNGRIFVSTNYSNYSKLNWCSQKILNYILRNK
jgi:hypothetical protein